MLFLYFEETALRFSHARSGGMRAPSRDACRSLQANRLLLSLKGSPLFGCNLGG